MSNDRIKEQHSKRILQKQNYVKKQTKIAKAYGISIKVGQEHRLQDHAVLNCGNSKCMLCMNPRKLFKELTIQEKRFNQPKLWKDDNE